MASSSAGVACGRDGVYVMLVNRDPAINVSRHDGCRTDARTTLGAAIAACDAQRVQEELNMPRHSFYIVRADRHRAVVPNDYGELSVCLAGAFKSTPHGQVGERLQIES